MTEIEFIEQNPGYGPPAPVPIIQREEEFSQLLDLYRERQPMRVLEVGTYLGGTLFHWLQNAPIGAVVISVDLLDNSHLFPGWCAEGVRCEAICGNSNEPETAAQAAEYAPFDWIFIDAGHFEHEVRADWALYGPLAAAGAVVSFHDIVAYPELPRVQVAPLWAELKERYETMEFCVEGGGGIGVLFVPVAR